MSAFGVLLPQEGNHLRLAHLSLVLLLILGLAVAPPGRASRADGIYFDDSGPEFMRLGNGFYEVALHKDNGGIAYIVDKATGQHISEGSLNRCLWVTLVTEEADYDGSCTYPATTYDDANRVEACNYWAGGANRFSYAWSATERRLLLRYTPDPAGPQKVTVTVTITTSEARWFDMQISLTNGKTVALDIVKFPADLLFVEDDLHEVLLPVLPGIVLESGFFDLAPCPPNGDNDRCYEVDYPGPPGVFADYVSLDARQGRFAMYAIPVADHVAPAHFGFISHDSWLPGRTYFAHDFRTHVPPGGVWMSPRVRVRIGEPRLDTINAFRADTGIAGFDSLRSKLGAAYDLIVRLPLYKADAHHLGIPFSAYGDVLARVPYPGILHLVAYQPPDFDENYPDFLPPDPQWGTTAEMAAMFQQAQALGYRVMPYINPTWWDDEWPTLRSLPASLTIQDVAARNEHGTPRYECYGWEGQHRGYVMCPYAPFVQQRLNRLMAEMTQDVPSDLLYEDQIGARPPVFDYNPAAPDAVAYVEGWLAHTRAYRQHLLTTENGFDRLAETEVGFVGSVRMNEQPNNDQDGSVWRWWGTGTWHYYPFAPMLFRDKVLLYHNAEVRGATITKQRLSFNLAFGYMLNYDLGHSQFSPPAAEWLEPIGAFQRYVLAAYADERLKDYTSLTGNVTRSLFEHTTVTMNWDQSNAYVAGGYVLPPEGVLVQRDDGSLTAGIFTAYNGAPLSSGDHYLIEERAANEIIVRQPMGADTSLKLTQLPGWDNTTRLSAWAYRRDGYLIGAAPVAASGDQLTFTYRAKMANQVVAYYRIAAARQTYLPLVLGQ